MPGRVLVPPGLLRAEGILPEAKASDVLQVDPPFLVGSISCNSPDPLSRSGLLATTATGFFT